ncbi:MAG: hypothetical protein LUE93_03180 [Bacteroides sp.]|nr:hypothetical protein [Bacteroides sp.]
MRAILFSLSLIIFALSVNVLGAERDELLRQLDKAVENRSFYMKKKSIVLIA